jgi:hypothetical protein
MPNLTESTAQSLSRFVVGLGSEWNKQYQKYRIDFAANPIMRDGVQIGLIPVANSGYYVGTLQWDFGARPAVVPAF